MLEVNELRIGNYVTYADKIIKVKGVINNTIYHSNGLFDQNTEPAYEPFRPIPLTEEILLKIGFGEIEYLGVKLWKLKKVTNKHICFIFFDDNLYLSENGEPCYEIIKYLHQLQNLYFALTGEELKINL